MLRPAEPRQFIGTSLLDAITTDSSSKLQTLFGRYGVFGAKDIHDAADTTGRAQALQISELEVFRSPVLRKDYERVRERLGGPKSFQSPCGASPALFRELYKLGQRAGDAP